MTLTKDQKLAVYNCVREMLWLDMVYNDHNFLRSNILSKAHTVKEALELASVDDANDFLDKLSALLEV